MFRKYNGFSARLLNQYNILYLSTDIDNITFSNVYDVSNSISRLLNENPDIIILILNCEAIIKMDSSGIGVLINIYSLLLKEKKQMYLMNITPHIMKIFKTLSIDDFFHFTTSVDIVIEQNNLNAKL